MPRNKWLPLFLALFIFFLGAGLIYGLKGRPGKPLAEVHPTIATVSTKMPVFYVNTDRKAVALTFDISWGDKTPAKVLDALAASNQKATFFLSGPWAKYYEETVRRIVEGGHEIASHGQEHDNLSQSGKDDIRLNIKSAHDILVNISGVSPKYFRPPNGDYDDLVVLVANELGYETVIWAVDSLDWKNPGVPYMVERVAQLVFPGAIMLFHASDSARETHDAVPLVLENLKSAGYDIMPLGQLMELGKPARDDPRGRPRDELPK